MMPFLYVLTVVKYFKFYHYELTRMTTHINEFLVTPLSKEDSENISSQARWYGDLTDKAFADSKKSEKFIFGLVIASLLYAELLFKGSASSVASFLNTEFATGIGLFGIGYLAYMWQSLKRGSKASYQRTSAISEEIERQYGIRIIMNNCVVINIDDYAYFFDVPSMQLSHHSKKRKRREK